MRLSKRRLPCTSAKTTQNHIFLIGCATDAYTAICCFAAGAILLLFTAFLSMRLRKCCYLQRFGTHQCVFAVICNVFEQLAQQMLLFTTFLNAVMHFCCYLQCFSLLLMLQPHIALASKASCEPKHRIKKTIGQYEYG